ncbi:nucleolar pre-ribosomal-associated protein 1-like [Gigantopelta aegis]|uniref:nucleolar pre-ribosomal-associated protein 1-like n=1 Tax=Gigantopelta aegis TaxID=1735272 RepID=UPI001B887B92|nr:nucleolar pre-ribosomal-associated protein 1-like [Gigantopelta aegis]
MSSVKNMKLSKKRKRKHLSDENTDETKETKKKKEEFTEIEFKLMLRDSNTIFVGLERFIETAQRFQEEEYDLVLQYCRSSNDCSEIFSLLEAEKRKPAEVALIFNTLECILIRIAGDLDKLKTVGQLVVQRLVASHLPLICVFLRMSNKSTQIKAALKLLCAMVMIGGSSCRAVISQFNFNHQNITPLFNRRDRKDDQDVRTCLVHFVMAFLLAGDKGVVRKLVEQKTMLQGILRGLPDDKLSTIQLVIPTVLEKVIQNPSVSKTSKVHLFSENILKQLSGMYDWQGPGSWKDKKSRTSSEVLNSEDKCSDQDSQLVAHMIHTLFLDLCCSFKNGICFFDKTFGTSGKNQNLLLTKMFTHLTKSLEKPLCKELITKFLITCPDQLQYVLSSLESSLTPRPSTKWIACMDFLIEVYTEQPQLPPVLSHCEGSTSQKLAAMVTVFFLPPEKVFHALGHSLKHKSAIVRCKVLELLKLTVQHATGVLRHCSTVAVASSAVDQNYWASVIELLRQNLLKCLPDDSELFACWKQMSSQENNDKGLDPELPPIDPLDQLILLEQVSCLYQDLYPSLLIENHQFLTLLLDSIRELGADYSGGEAEKRVLPQLYLLKLLAGTDARKLPWSKTLKDGHTLMYLLLDMMRLVQHNSRLMQMTQTLICKLLASTNLFEGTEKELEIWFQHFAKHLTLSQSTVMLKFMAQILTTFVSNPFPYIEKVTELLAESTSQLDTSGAGDTRSIGTAESVIDAILEMEEDDFLMLDNSDSHEMTNSDSSPRLPFSPVVLVSLETLESSEEFKTSVALRDLLCSVLLDVFHTQLDPSPLSVLLEQHLSVFGKTSEIIYITSWSPNKKASSWKPSKEVRLAKSVSKLLMCLQATSFVMDSKFQERLISAVAILSVQDSVKVVQQILLFVRKIIDRFEQMNEKGPVLLKMLFGLLKEIKEHLLKFTENRTVSNNVSEMSEFDMLDVKEATANEALIDFVKTVVDHPYIEKWFLFNRGILNSTKMKPDSERLLTQLVTQQLMQVLDGLPSALSVGIQRNVQGYCNEINNTLASIREEKPTMCDFSIVLRSMGVLVKYVDFEYQTGFLDTLLSFPISHLIHHGKVKKLSNAGKLVIQLASATLSGRENSRSQGKELSLSKMATIFDLLTVSSDSFLEDYCHLALQKEKSYAVVVGKDLFHGLLRELTESRADIVQHVLGNNVACRLLFEKWTIENEIFFKENKVLLTKPVQVYLMTLKQKNENYERQTKVCLDVIRRVYMKKKTNVVSESSDCLTIIHLLMHMKAVDDSVMLEYWKALSHSTEAGSSLMCEHVEIIMLLHQRLSQSECNKEQTLLLLMRILMNSCAKKEDRNVKLEDDVLLLIEQFLQSDVMSLGNAMKVIWSQFVKVSLKSLYLNPKLLRILSQLLSLVYTESGDISLPITSLHQMAMSHSQFLPVMFDEKGDEIKESLVCLLVDLVERSPECCSTSHCGLLLGSYNASLSITDQTILKLIYIYEQQGSWMKDQRPFLWGPKAIEHYSARKNLGLSLWKHPSMEQVLDNLDVQKMYRSILHFPLRRNIVPDGVCSARELQSKPDVYDPCFLLPLFSILLSPDSVADCRKFVELHCLGYTFAALSSHMPDMRRAAYHILSAFIYHLEGSRIQERTQITCVLEVLRNSCQEANVKLACIISIFLAKAARQQLKIDDHMYRIVNTFLTLKPDMDIANVPEFYKLFRSSVLEFREDRSWILSLLVDGLRDTADYRVMERRFTFKLLLTFHDSALSDSQCQVQVLKIVRSACSVKTVASDLVKTHGLVTWLNAAILSMRAEKVSLIAEILHTLWFTLLEQWKTPATEEQSSPAQHKHVLPLRLSREMLLCVKGFMQNCGSCSLTAWLNLLEVMVSTIQNINTVMGKLHAQGHLIDVETLSLKDVCFVLLHSARHLHQDDTVTFTSDILKDLGYEPKLVSQDSSKSDTNRRRVPETSNSVSRHEITEDGDDDQKPDSTEDKKKQVDQEPVDSTNEQKDRITENQLMVKTVEACLFWNPSDGCGAGIQEHTVTGILVSASWLLRSIALKDRAVIHTFLEWMKKHLSSDNRVSKMCIDRLLSGSHFTVGLLNGMLDVYTFLLSGEVDDSLKLKAVDVPTNNASSHCLGLLNTIVLSLLKSAAAKTSIWTELLDHVNKWKDETSMRAQELLSLTMREFLMESRLTAQPKPILRWFPLIKEELPALLEKNWTSKSDKSVPCAWSSANYISSSEYDSDDEMTSSSKSESSQNVAKHLTKLKHQVRVKRKTSIDSPKKNLKDVAFSKVKSTCKRSKSKPLLKVTRKQLKRHKSR